MKYLQIEIFDSQYNRLGKIVASHLDASTQKTEITGVLSIESQAYSGKFNGDLFEISELDHHDTVAGMVTLYYKNGLIAEVTRLNA